MTPPSHRLRERLRLAVLALALLFAAAGLGARVASSHGPAEKVPKRTPALAALAATDFRNFEAPQIHPLALTPDGTRLLAVNTPNGTLSVFQLTNGDNPLPARTAEIPVGLEPVSVAARNDREAWVVNWLSDSVSVVDLATGNVTRTIDVGDEPTDVLFAGTSREMAFVSVSGRNQIRVFDPSNPAATPQVIDVFGKQPRSLARNAAGSEVYVSIFESGNKTTVVPELTVKNNGGLPPPNPAMAPGLPAAPSTGLIVRHNGAAWTDELGRSWNQHIPFTLADIDLVVLNASGVAASVGAQVRSLGTHVGNAAFDPSNNRLVVANTDSTSATRFEPNLQGRFQSSRVSFVNLAGGPAVGGVFDLNPHVNFTNPAGTDAERELSLAQPADIVRAADGTVFVAAMGSARVGVVTPAGAVRDRVRVGQGPTGLALDERRNMLYVLNRVDQTVSFVDLRSNLTTLEAPVGFNPEPANVRAGRRFLYDAGLSAHGTVSCASCHQDGHRDGLAWDLGNPQGQVDSVTVRESSTNVEKTFQHHPMKGPMTTQSLRDIVGKEPMHWRGDRTSLAQFNGAFTSLLGSPRRLTDAEMAAFEAFVSSLTYPPNPLEPPTRLSSENQGGFGFFAFERLFGGQPNGRNCADCHLVRNFGAGTDKLMVSAADLREPQAFKTPHLRGLYQKTGMDKSPGEKITGFGFGHDGTFDTMFNFQKAPQFNFSHVDTGTADSWRRDMEQLMLRLDTGTAPAVGLQVTVNAANKTSPDVLSRIDLLMEQSPALNQNCDLVVKGIYGGAPRAFQHLGNETFQPDSNSEAPVTLQALLDSVGPGTELTFTGVPVGTGRRLALDRDGDGILNDDGPRSSVQLTGRVVDALGNGVAGVTVTLGGRQTSVAQTDATGKFTFGFVSTTGTHVVTPSGGGLSFAPASRSISNPKWNQTAYFVAPAGPAAAIDATQFYVTQHYNDFFGREPDAAGLAFWSNQINECQAIADAVERQRCHEIRRINVSAAFYLSIEFQRTGFLVHRLSEASFDRMPRYGEFFPDQQRLGRGVVVGVGSWEALLETNQQAFLRGWVERPAFRAVFDPLTNEQYVERLVANAGIEGQIDKGALVAGLSAGAETRASVLLRVAEHGVFVEREKNRAFVLMQYLGYLRRNPEDPPEATLDLAGFNFWLQKLNNHGGNFVAAEMVKSFLVSGEYLGRFRQ